MNDNQKLDKPSRKKARKSIQRIKPIIAIFLFAVVALNDVDSARGDVSSELSKLTTIYNAASSQYSNVSAYGASSEASQAKSLLDTLLSQRLKLQRQGFDIGSLESQIRDRKSNMNFRKSEWESAERNYQRLRREYESKLKTIDSNMKSLSSKIADLQRRIKAHNKDADAAKAASKSLDAEWARYRRTRAATEAKRSGLDRTNQAAVNAFNAEVNRNNAWLGRLKTRSASRKSWGNRINSRKASLDREQDSLKARGKRYIADRASIITQEGRKMLDARLKASKKQREYFDARKKVAELAQKLDPLLKSFNSDLQSAYNTAAKLNSAISNAYRVALAKRQRDRILVTRPRVIPKTKSTPKISKPKPRPTPKLPKKKPIITKPPLVKPGIKPAPKTPFNDIDLTRKIDPRNLILPSSYDSAKNHRTRLKTLEKNLAKKLEELRKQRKGTRGYLKEFEQIREEAVRGALLDLLSVFQFDKLDIILEGLKTVRQLERWLPPERIKVIQAYLTPDRMKAIGATMNAMKMSLTHDMAVNSKEDLKKLDARINTMLEGQQYVEHLISQLPDIHPARKRLEAMRQMIQISLKLAKFSKEQYGKPKRESILTVLGEGTKLGIEIAAVFNPLVASAVAVENLGERAAKLYITNEAVNSLGAALALNYKADIFLSEKLKKTRDFLKAQEDLIRGYETINKKKLKN
ncbi:MAG: hypothetical protein Tsb009_30950 [Planctomycetaceae bacterium]